MVLKRDRRNEDSNEKEYLHARYLEDTKIKLFQEFPCKDQMSRSSFEKYLNSTKVYKKAHRFEPLIFCTSVLFRFQNCCTNPNFFLKSLRLWNNIKILKKLRILPGMAIVLLQAVQWFLSPKMTNIPYRILQSVKKFTELCQQVFFGIRQSWKMLKLRQIFHTNEYKCSASS